MDAGAFARMQFCPESINTIADIKRTGRGRLISINRQIEAENLSQNED